MRFAVAILVLAGPALWGCAREVVEPELEATALPPRSAASGPRFVRRDPGEIGLDFRNELRPENVFAYVYTGSGVAVGDYDADGLPDVYLVSQDGANKLFRQTGPLRFEDVTEAAGGLGGGDAWGSAPAFVDIDDDGDLDLYVCNLESPNLLYLNQGDGTFREGAGPRGLAAVAASMGAAFADYDNDGDLDLYLVTNRVLGTQLPEQIVAEMTLPGDLRKTREQLFPPYPRFTQRDGQLVVPPGYEDFVSVVGDKVFPAGQRDRLYRNDGGVFHEVTAEAGIADQGNGLSAVWWDFDGDQKLDLYVANDLQSPDVFYRNRGDGTFENVTASVVPYTAFFGMGCDFGDIDRDGRFDLLVADMSSTTHYMGKMLMGNMDQHRWLLMNGEPLQQMRNVLFLNTGTGRMQEAAQLCNLASTDWTWSVRFADFDEDGWLDVHATNGIPVFTDNPDAGREFKQLWDHGATKLALDLYRKLPRVEERNVARRNLGGLEFEDVSAEWGLDEESVGQGAVVCDLDRDGDLDIIVNNLNQPASLFENRTAGSHRLLVELRGTDSNSRGIGARIEVVAGGARQTRLVMGTRGYMSAGEAVEHFGLGTATTVDSVVVHWPSGAMQSFTEIAADQHLLIREAHRGQGAVREASPLFSPREVIPFRHREREFDDYAVQPLLPHRLSRAGPSLATADINGDGRDDVWVGGAAGQAGALWLSDGESYREFVGPWRDDAECEDMGAALFDADGDGDLDLYVVSGGVEAGVRAELLRDRVYINEGDRWRLAKDASPMTTSGSCVAPHDFDGDGDVDLFVGSRVVPGRFPYAPASALLSNEGGRFIDRTADLAPALRDAGMVTDAVWVDLDGDGRAELAVAAQWQPIRVLGFDGERFADRTLRLGIAEVRGQWNSLAAADLDGDGDLDLVATNLGLNTKYHASPEHPQRLYASDLDNNGTVDIVEAKTSGGAALPVRGLSCSSSAMPFLKQKFDTYDKFARATLAEIYGESLQQCFTLECNELRHVVFENLDGKLVPHPLPRAAQVSAGYGLGIADFDRDGKLDILMGHNTYSPEPETGPNAGGLSVLLRGRGELAFEAVPADRSGIVVPGDVADVAVLDLNGDSAPDVLFALNDGPLRAFVQQRGAR